MATVKHAFKKGDIITPKKGRKSSNGFELAKLVKLKVTEVLSGDWQKKRVTAIILEGTITTKHGWDYRKKGERVTFYQDAFIKIGGSEDYEIF